MERLPLGSVRTFAVVARLMSLSRAAEELSVTPSAVSHQIRTLEDYLGVVLFRRDKNKLKLTHAGEKYMAEVSAGLLILARATKAIKGQKGHPVISVGAPPSFAVLWLVSRLGAFTRDNPDVGVNLTTVPDPAPLMQGAFDVVFWYGHGGIAGMTVDSLGRNCVFPVCSPALLEKDPPLTSPADLTRHVLLDSLDETYYRYKEPRQPSWYEWSSSAGLSEVNGARQLNFTPRLVMQHAAVAGIGVGLSRSLLALDDLASGKLVVPFGPAIPLHSTYNVVCPTGLAKRKDIALFRDWVLAEAATSRKSIDKLLKEALNT